MPHLRRAALVVAAPIICAALASCGSSVTEAPRAVESSSTGETATAARPTDGVTASTSLAPITISGGAGMTASPSTAGDPGYASAPPAAVKRKDATGARAFVLWWVKEVDAAAQDHRFLVPLDVADSECNYCWAAASEELDRREKGQRFTTSSAPGATVTGGEPDGDQASVTLTVQPYHAKVVSVSTGAVVDEGPVEGYVKMFVVTWKPGKGWQMREGGVLRRIPAKAA